MRLSKKLVAGLGDRSNLSEEHNEVVTSYLHYLVNNDRGTSMSFLSRNKKYLEIKKIDLNELLRYAEYLLMATVPFLRSSLHRPMSLANVIGRLWKDVPQFTCTGWDMLWYLRAIVNEDGTVSCYAKANKIIASRYIADIVPDGIKDDDYLFFFYYTESLVRKVKWGKKYDSVSTLYTPKNGMDRKMGYPGKHRDAWMRTERWRRE